MMRIVAVGNGAGNIVDQLRKSKSFPDIEFIFCDTDHEDLGRHGSSEDKHVYLTPNMEKVRADVHSDNDFATILVCCLGGKTTSKYALEIAWELWDYSDKTYFFATIPASYEGPERRANALKVFEDITKEWKKSEISILQDNDKLPGSLSISQMDNGMVRLIDLLASHNKKIGSEEEAEFPFAVWATNKQAFMALRALYCNDPELSDYYKMHTFSFHNIED